MGKIVLTESQQEWLINNFANTKNEEILEKLGFSLSTLHRMTRRFGLKKSRQYMKDCQEYMTKAAWVANKIKGWPPKGYIVPNRGKNAFKKGETNLQRIGAEREAERIRRCIEARNKTLAAERRRVLFGLPQKTRLKIGCSKKKINYRYRMRKHGYIIERGGNEAYVCDTTVRSPLIERNAVKHGIRIVV